MPTVLEPPPSTEVQLPGAVPDPEALIREARRRQRRRRGAAAAFIVLLAALGIAVWQLAFAQASRTTRTTQTPRPLVTMRTLTLHLVGWGTPVEGYAPGTPCPDGVFTLPIRSSTGATIGSDSECDLVDSKVDSPAGRVLRTYAILRATYRVPGGTLETREQRTFRFSRDQIHTSGLFTGRIIGGSGRYAHARGSISGGGPGGANSANWTVAFHFR